ncbi:MAG: ribonuclease P protein component [Clostridia bacterium]|nr:ribonuclease P protein component [Clostridia bacterium]
MQKYLSLNENKDFQRAYHRGKSCAKPALVVYAMKNRVGICRVGITVSKKIGNAVERNRSRRIIRAAFQNIFKAYGISGNYDFVFVARTKTKYLKTPQVEKAMLELLKEVGAIK